MGIESTEMDLLRDAPLLSPTRDEKPETLRVEPLTIGLDCVVRRLETAAGFIGKVR